MTYGAGSVLLVAVLAVDLEGNIVGSVALDLEGTGRQVVEVAVEQLDGENNVSWVLELGSGRRHSSAMRQWSRFETMLKNRRR